MHRVSLRTYVDVLERRRSSGWQEKKQEASELFPVTASFNTLALSQDSVEARKQGSKLLRMLC